MQRFAFVGLLLLLLSSVSAAPAAPPPLRAGFPRSDMTAPISLSGPAAVDLNSDGQLEILLGDGGACVRGWDASGTPLSGFPLQTDADCAGPARIIAPLAVGNLDADSALEIVAGTLGVGTFPNQRGEVWAWNLDGSMVGAWPKEMSWDAKATGAPAISSVALAQVEASPELEVQYTTTNNASRGTVGVDIAANAYARRGDATLIPVYPTWASIAGINGALASADITCDGLADLITGRNHGYLHAYNGSGRQPLGWPVRTYVDPNQANPATDPLIAFPRSAPALGDIDGDGQLEVSSAGELRDASGVTRATGLLVFHADGTRAAGWTQPLTAGAPLTTTMAALQAVALGDLSGDARPELVLNVPDGTIRAYNGAGGELWRFDYAQNALLLASEPILGDVDGDGRVDVVFGVYSPDGSANAAVGVYALDGTGQPLAGFPLALGAETAAAQGVRAAPTLADLDSDGTLELLAASLSGVLYVWDLGVPADPARLPWPTARHDIWRSGSLNGGPQPALAPSFGPFTLFLPILFHC